MLKLTVDDAVNDEAEDILVPPFASTQRHSTLLPATFNLVATIVGGGVLSLPLAFSKCASIPGLALFLFVLAGFATDRSLYMLCRASRWCGAATYGEVARCAFGKSAEWFVSGLLAVFLLFVITGYLVLIRDIWTPLVSRWLGHGGDNNTVAFDNEDEAEASRWQQKHGNLVLLGAVVVLIPFLVQKDLHALRYNCYAGFASISILCAALWFRALAGHDDNGLAIDDAVPSDNDSTSFANIVFAFPIIILSYLSQFNILPIHAALVQPTRSRIQQVTVQAVGASGLLMYLFGRGGHLCFGDKVQGNILLNLKNDQQWMVLAGRVGCGVTILFATPMMLLPCRRNILELIDCYLEYRHQNCSQQQSISQYSTIHPPTEHSRLMPSFHTSPGRSPSLEERVHLGEHPVAHYLSTLIIMLVCYVAAVAAPGVAFVWSLCGCSMAFAIAFILPAACLLQIQRKYNTGGESNASRYWKIGASSMLVLALVSAIVCTVQTTYSLVDPHPHRQD